MRNLIAVIAVSLFAAACAPVESAGPRDALERFQLRYCLTSSDANHERCTSPRIAKAVSIYNRCLLDNELPDGSRVSIAKEGCLENKEWIMSTNSFVEQKLSEMKAKAAKEAASNALKVRIDKCLSSSNNRPFKYEYFGDSMLKVAHPDCDGVVDQAVSEKYARKRRSCNSGMERYGKYVADGDFYRAQGAIESAVDSCD